MQTPGGLEAQVRDLLRRVDELESRVAIRDLVSEYCIGFDRRDLERFMGIWHPDAVWEIGPPFGSFSGAANIRRAVRDTLFPAWRETHHLASNLVVTFSDPDHARGVCDVDCMGATPDDVVQMISASYADDFERRQGVWKITRRVVTLHYFNPVPGAQMTPPPAG